MKPLYSETQSSKTPRYRSPIAAAKELIPTEDFAGELTELTRRGDTWVGCCALPDHDDRTPSFYVYSDGGWWCYGCSRGGDVIDLARLAWGYREQAMTVVAEELLKEYGHDVPERKPSPLRRDVEDSRLLSLQRRIYRLLLQDIIVLAEGEDRAVEEAELWRDARRVALREWARRTRL